MEVSWGVEHRKHEGNYKNLVTMEQRRSVGEGQGAMIPTPPNQDWDRE